MKHKVLKQALATVALLLCSMVAMAQTTATVDGITYEFITKAKLATVVATTKTGDIVIPEIVGYDGAAYSVTAIGDGAFFWCSSLTSITIPNSVTTIGGYAFYDCSGLTSVTIPNSVTTIGGYAFSDCDGLTSVTIPNSVTTIGEDAFSGCSGLTAVHISDLSAWCNIDFGDNGSNPLPNAHNLYLNGNLVTDLVIPGDITEIKDYAFYGCSGLTSITIPNSVTTIGGGAFEYCTGLKSVAIGNGVTTIGGGAFEYCTGLTSVTIPNSVTTIGGYAFYGCSGLTSVTIPNSVTTIGGYAFCDCSGLESVKIGESVKTIESNTFANCGNLTDVYCYATSVPWTESNAFENSYIEYATLHVPEESIDSYKSTEPWSSFGTKTPFEGELPGTQTPVTPKCATPVITYSAGKLSITCDTEDAQFVTTIADSDIRTHYGSTIELTVTYNITTYATLAGYENSDTIQATLCWIDSTPTMEQIGTDVTEIASTPVLVRSSDGNIFVSGASEGTAIRVYSVDGMSVGSAVSNAGETTVPTTLQKGKTAIVAIGDSRIKMVMR